MARPERRRAARMPALCLALSLATGLALPAAAATGLAGRWEGEVAIPGAPQALVLDLDGDATRGWTASVILPGRGIKGVAPDGLEIADAVLRFGLAAAFDNGRPEDAPRVQLGRQDDGTLAGQWRQGGHVAPLRLRRSGDAQVDRPPAPRPLAAELVGTWIGRYAIGGVPREATLTLERGAGGLGRGELRIVGPRRSVLAVDLVDAGPRFVILAVSAAGLRIEARRHADTLDGHLVQGPFEAPLVLRRSGGAAP